MNSQLPHTVGVGSGLLPVHLAATVTDNDHATMVNVVPANTRRILRGTSFTPPVLGGHSIPDPPLVCRLPTTIAHSALSFLELRDVVRLDSALYMCIETRKTLHNALRGLVLCGSGTEDELPQVCSKALRWLISRCVGLRRMHSCGTCFLQVLEELVILVSSDMYDKCTQLLFGHTHSMQVTQAASLDGYWAFCKQLHTLDLSLSNQLTDSSVSALATLSQLHTLDLSFCQLITDASVVVLFTSLPQLQYLNVSRCHLLTDASVVALATHCPDLQSLNLSSCFLVTGVSVSALATLSNLHALDLYQCNLLTEPSLSTLSQLKSLDLSYCRQLTCALVSALAILPHLISLSLSSCSQVTNAYVCALASLSQLRVLNLSHCDRITDASVLALSTRSKLKYLNLSSCYWLTDASVSLLFLSEIQSLSLSRCGLVTDASVLVLSKLPQLRILDLSYCCLLTDASVVALAAHCPILRHLNMSGCILLTDESVVAMATMCPKLQSLDINSCHLVTASSLSLLATHYLRQFPTLNFIAVPYLLPPKPRWAKGYNQTGFDRSLTSERNRVTIFGWMDSYLESSYPDPLSTGLTVATAGTQPHELEH
jgi:hypothetical protein